MARPRTPVDPRRMLAERNVETILDAGEQLLLSGRALNFSTVAAEAEVSRPTVYAHFADRTQLVSALVLRSVDRATEAMRSAEPERGPADDALRRVIAIGWENMARHQVIARAVISDLSTEMVHVHHQRAEALLKKIIERGQDEGTFRNDLTASWLASSCLAVIHGAASVVASGQMRHEAAVDALTTTAVDLCVGTRPRRERRR